MIMETHTQTAKDASIQTEMDILIQTVLGTQITGQMPLKMMIHNGQISMEMDLAIIGAIVHGQIDQKTGQVYL